MPTTYVPSSRSSWRMRSRFRPRCPVFSFSFTYRPYTSRAALMGPTGSSPIAAIASVTCLPRGLRVPGGRSSRNLALNGSRTVSQDEGGLRSFVRGDAPCLPMVCCSGAAAGRLCGPNRTASPRRPQRQGHSGSWLDLARLRRALTPKARLRLIWWWGTRARLHSPGAIVPNAARRRLDPARTCPPDPSSTHAGPQTGADHPSKACRPPAFTYHDPVTPPA